jgi:hypothetical protein
LVTGIVRRCLRIRKIACRRAADPAIITRHRARCAVRALSIRSQFCPPALGRRVPWSLMLFGYDLSVIAIVIVLLMALRKKTPS